MEEKAEYKVEDKRFKEADVINLPSTDLSPGAMISKAVQTGTDLNQLEKLLELQIKWEGNEAKKAYHRAMAEFKKNPPDIEKDRRVSYKAGGGTTEYSHASLANVTKKINKALGEQGLSASWETKQENGSVTVTCRITHEQGHSEETSLTASPDTSGSKNAIQAIGSTISYLERYTVLALTGLATSDMDDDGGKQETGEPSKFEQWSIKLDEAIESGLETLEKWWPLNSEQIKKECSKPEAAKLYSKYVDEKKKMKNENPS